MITTILAALLAAIHLAIQSTVPAVDPSDVFQRPLSSWAPHCLGFGSQWRYCNGVALRACPSGAIWLHTGIDVVARAGEPVAAAGDGTMVGYTIDPQFRGGVRRIHIAQGLYQGVDLNRNYPTTTWGQETRQGAFVTTSRNPADAKRGIWAGPSAASEVETQQIVSLMAAQKFLM